MNKENKRPNIPIKIQLQLWVISAGRCEFPGCNEFLLKDDLTLSEGNYSNIAHIIAWTSGGPRGDKELSPKLAKDISNLMLMCQKHGKLIDIEENLFFYTVDFLRECKEVHEQRIKIQTDIDISRKTTVVRIQTNIRGIKVEVSQSDACNALILAGHYPADEKGILIDLTNLDYSTDKQYWETATKQIDSILATSMMIGNDGIKKSHFSIFGIAPIPLLVSLGFKMGNAIPADIYIKLREKPWSIWSNSSDFKILVDRINSEKQSGVVGLSISISGKNSKEEIIQHIGEGNPIYEISIPDPKIDAITSVEDLEIFRKSYRQIIDEIREKHGKKTVIHLFGAMPTCASVVCGREILHGVDPQLVIYEHIFEQNGFVPALKIN